MRKCLIISFDFSKDGYPPISYSVASILAKFKNSDFIEIERYSCDMNEFLEGSEDTIAEIETHIVECFEDEFIKNINDYSFIALSAYAWSEKLVNAFIKTLRSTFTGKIILGGYEVTALKKEQLLKIYPDVDYYVKGYAEKSLEEIFKNTAKEKILDMLPDDDTEFVSPYLSETLPLTTEKIYWESKRGCPYKCDFCEWGNAEKGKIIRINRERIDSEIDLFKQKNIQHIHVLDATFLVNEEDIRTLEKLLEIPNCNIVLQSHFNSINGSRKNKFLKLCQNHRDRISLEFGLQTIHENEMEVLQRKNNIEHIKTVMEELNSRNIKYEITIIFGIPGQTVTSFKDTIKFIENHGCEKFRAFPLRLPQNSKMKEKAEELKIKESQSQDELYSLQIVTESYSFTYSDWEEMYSIANKHNKDKFVSETWGKAVVPIIGKVVYHYFMGGLQNIINSNADINIFFDKKIKEKLRLRIVKYLQNDKALDNIVLSGFGIDNYADAIKIILPDSVIRELCANDTSIAEYIAEDILDFINKTTQTIRQILETDNPFKDEYKRLDKFKATKPENFEKTWKTTVPFIKKYYKSQINTEFYYGEFQKSLLPPEKEKYHISFQSVKEYFTDKWESLLFNKKLKWELNIIEEERKKFCEKLYLQIERLKKLQELFDPFMWEFGRLWDMSKGRWQKVNFGILEKYAKLLDQDKSLQELAEMLGRMRQAEREYEKEIFAKMVAKPMWKIEHAAKSELVGIHESNDIGNILPMEAALLADDEIELLFYKKFVEKKLQTFDYQAKTLSHKEEEIQNKRQKAKENKKGPIIICVDTSGSMHGTPEQVAKTLSFALLKIAISENRKCYLISFSTGIETLELTDIRNNLEKLLEFLSMSFNGGTDTMPAMEEALRMLETEDYKKADVVMQLTSLASIHSGNRRLQKSRRRYGLGFCNVRI